MAEEVQIPGAGSTAKIRNVIAVAVLSIVTLGIYFCVWYYKVNREMVDYGKATGRSEEFGDSPLTSLLAVTLGALIIVPALVSLYRCFQRVQALQRSAGGGDPINGWIGLILLLVFSPALYAYMQSGLNSAWEALRSTAPGGAASVGPAPEGVS